MRIQAWCIGASAALCAVPAAAVNTDGHDGAYATASGVYLISDGARPQENGYGFQVTVGYPIELFDIENLAIEASFFDTEMERELDGLDDYQTGYLFVDLVKDFGLYGWGEESWIPRFKPYVLGGIGWVNEDALGEDHNHVGLDAGGGALWELPWWGMGVRTEARLQLQSNDQTVPDEDLLMDWRVLIGLQIPLTPFFKQVESVLVSPARDCDVAVVDPETGRSDCAADSDRDGVADSADRCPGTPPATQVDAYGCATGSVSEAPAAPSAPVTTSGLPAVRFEFNSDRLTADSERVLDSVAATLKADAASRAEVIGHTDSMGTEAYNLKLSQGRAETVKGYLAGRGVDAARLSATGRGEGEPVASNDSEEGRAENRRVELRVHS